MARTAPRVELTEAEQHQLQALLRRTTIPLRTMQRARILLGAAAGQENQALAATLKLPPATVGRVRQRFAAQRLGALADAPDHQVWRVLRQRGISLPRRRSWCVSTDPEFDRKAADIVGLYLAAPVNAVVLRSEEHKSE